MKPISASIITIGDELLIGQTIDTNSAFIGQELNRAGIWLKRRVAVGDLRDEILQALEAESRENDILIITGGLGPTADDITKPALRDYFAAGVRVDEDALQNVHDIFSRFGRKPSEVNLKQAEVPDNCTVLPNRRGTAPGMWFEKDGVVYVSLPGVPHEMKGLITDSVLPRLKERFTLPGISHRTALTAGKGESDLAAHIADFEAALPSWIKLAYLPSYGLVRLRLTARGDDATAVETELDRQFNELKHQVREWLVADEDISLPEALHRVLKARGRTVGTAESCTGGYLARLLTEPAGASAIFLGGVVAYANDIKEHVLGVPAETLRAHGAVSEETVRAMVAGALQVLGTDYALATSGIMGPTGGTPEKPVGTIWVAVGNRERTDTLLLNYRFDRARNMELTANAALNFLRRFILNDL
ncbi:CinA family nicotinamide mononucleotide deamidase-related protein [Flaviaesturariibacter flavus]|uniref:CinA-like protein n=1 Tax=Flaviaesturariibacter flavus TaxID=2502780 RepID=A0A4R1BPY9_9BACT|nr:CinA family nicotinamide mononucleotide deamidase-related protein [Flaviaesturariibacter flavus]TCJ19641.1 CinA family nicotinamide mononucleotide deamidase-related protein [Flaviaesturariibacter flavus]